MRKVKVNEYEVIEDFQNGVFKALRHGQEWRDLIGDQLVLSLMDKLIEARELLQEAKGLLDDDCYGYEEVHSAISRHLNGEEN